MQRQVTCRKKINGQLRQTFIASKIVQLSGHLLKKIVFLAEISRDELVSFCPLHTRYIMSTWNVSCTLTWIYKIIFYTEVVFHKLEDTWALVFWAISCYLHALCVNFGILKPSAYNIRLGIRTQLDMNATFTYHSLHATSHCKIIDISIGRCKYFSKDG